MNYRHARAFFAVFFPGWVSINMSLWNPNDVMLMRAKAANLDSNSLIGIRFVLHARKKIATLLLVI